MLRSTSAQGAGLVGSNFTTGPLYHLHRLHECIESNVLSVTETITSVSCRILQSHPSAYFNFSSSIKSKVVAFDLTILIRRLFLAEHMDRPRHSASSASKARNMHSHKPSTPNTLTSQPTLPEESNHSSLF